ncbi:transporter substrate-binding domain-containing protein [Clostridium ljungdahlii]|uniref:L-cystine-binding protein TcyK n=1 Tax=Clostridium ljungdahlii TaxID=1538 RepID=A0A162KTZ7_9CLOT|nr:transporter substrate-binding domain-containing protein [Clostridium ljungdahlii]OAA83946.1 L-cystine-binding protein TcyK precursor [Clostridium ljungdahlii]
MKKIKKVMIAFVLGALVMSVYGCGKKPSSSSNESVKKIQVATSGTPKPFNFVGSDNKPTGFEIDLLKKIDEQLPDYDFQYNVTEFGSLFPGLDSKRYDLVINNLSRSKEREAKYVVSKQSYFEAPIVLIVNEDNKNVKSIDDIGGLRIPAGSGRANALFLEDYNKKNSNNPVKINYTDSGADQLLIDLHNNRYDAAIYSETYVDYVEKEYGYKYKIINLSPEQQKQLNGNSPAWIFYNQDDKKLRDEVDKVLKKFTQDGTLSNLSKKWFNGKDYSRNLPVSEK